VPSGTSPVELSNIFAPAGAPADAIRTISLLVLAITAVIFLLVGGLLAYCCVRYRSRAGDDGREPPQVYGSNPVELAWTVVPVLIVFVLITTTTRTIYEIQAAAPPADAVHVRVVGHQWWWEFQYPELGVVTANELHVRGQFESLSSVPNEVPRHIARIGMPIRGARVVIER